MANPLRAAEWLATLPHCAGYPTCDGDLEGMAHSESCPMYGRKQVTKSDTCEAYAAYLLSELECEFQGESQTSMSPLAGAIATDYAQAVAAFRKRVMGEGK